MAGKAAAAAGDAAARTRALESPGSVLVRAPAGSGKTELLVQRFLRLLAAVDEPEALAAVTFTRKAAGEMRDRVLHAIAAAGRPAPEEAHARRTWELARAAANRDAERGWNLSQAPARLRITTLDGLALSIASQIPWRSGFGAPPSPSEDCEELYRTAARETLARLETEETGSAAARGLLRHLLGDYARAEKRLAEILANRDQWLPLAQLASEQGDGLRPHLDANFREAIEEELEPLREALRREGIAPPATATEAAALADTYLTKAGGALKRGPRPDLDPRVCELLHAARGLPAAGFTRDGFRMLAQVLELMRLAAAELQIVFAGRGVCDFTEIALRAAVALSEDGAGTELARRLDARIQHLFVDEFQDTSQAQFDLIARLVADWTSEDGRTLFLVGDAMQSIYGFRDAQVELFQKVVKSGQLGPVRLEVLDLTHNFRSQPELVAWTNEVFRQAAQASGLAGFHVEAVSRPARRAGARVAVHAVPGVNRATEAVMVADIVQQELNAGGKEIALLANSRGHLDAILPELARRGIEYQGVDLLNVGEAPAVRDLLALTKALHLPGDRLSWLAVLRAPWCGLRLASLYALCGDEPSEPVPALLADAARRARLSEEERQRLEAVWPALEAAAYERGRGNMRALTEWTWRKLGGDALAGGDRAAADAFLDLLRVWEERGRPGDFAGLEIQMERLYAPPDPNADGRVVAMTMHAAKGLEFDTVILPGLTHPLRGIEHDLVRFEGVNGLAATMPAPGSSEEMFTYAGQRIARRTQGERLRLLYVAATRAKRRLHLIGESPRVNVKSGEMGRPHSHSLLARIWTGVKEEFERQFGGSSPEAEQKLSGLRAPVENAPAPSLRRLREIAPQGEIAVRKSARGAKPVPLGADELPRRVGIAVHALLQEMAESGRLEWNAERLRTRLRAEGVGAHELGEAERRAGRALELTLSDERGRWILSRHAGDRCEWALSGGEGAEIENRVLDRSFVEQGVRWIVDFKTAAPSDEDFSGFVRRQAELYRAQLADYQRLVEELGEGLPIRCGLYFPLLEAGERWVEIPTA